MQPAATPTPTVSLDPAKPSRSGGLLGLVRKLIGYGRELAATLRQRNDPTTLGPVMRAFASTDIARIIARIVCGLHRAQALEQKILRNAARLDADPQPQTSPSPRKPRAARPAAPRASQADAGLAPLPTPEQIAAKVRRQSIGAVIADICRDLGIRPDHPLWRELQTAMTLYNGNYARLVIEIIKRPRLALWEAIAAAIGVEPDAVVCATGPP